MIIALIFPFIGYAMCGARWLPNILWPSSNERPTHDSLQSIIIRFLNLYSGFSFVDAQKKSIWLLRPNQLKPIKQVEYKGIVFAKKKWWLT